MLPPQSDDEVRPVIEGLRALDPLLSIRWNPEAVQVAPGSYTALGKLTRPTFDGRWEIIRYATPHGRADRDFTLITAVTAPTEMAGQRVMIANGPYAPVGEWLLDYMRAADAANVRAFAQIRERLWRETDRLDTEADASDDAKALEALDRVHFGAAYAGGVGNWSTGFTFTPE